MSCKSKTIVACSWRKTAIKTAAVSVHKHSSMAAKWLDACNAEASSLFRNNPPRKTFSILHIRNDDRSMGIVLARCQKMAQHHDTHSMQIRKTLHYGTSSLPHGSKFPPPLPHLSILLPPHSPRYIFTSPAHFVSSLVLIQSSL